MFTGCSQPGSNGNGTTQLGRIRGGVQKLIREDNWPSDRPFIVLSPQHPGEGCHTAAETGALMEYALMNYEIDPNRVYLTGLSCGGIGTWTHLGAFGDQYVAAAVPIAGNGQRAWTQGGCAMRDVAIWAFHGDADARVDVSGTTNTVANLENCEGENLKELRMTIYPGVPHDSWTRTYTGQAMTSTRGYSASTVISTLETKGLRSAKGQLFLLSSLNCLGMGKIDPP